MSLHRSDQISQSLYDPSLMSKIKSGSLSESVSEWVTRSPIELSVYCIKILRHWPEICKSDLHCKEEDESQWKITLADEKRLGQRGLIITNIPILRWRRRYWRFEILLNEDFYLNWGWKYRWIFKRKKLHRWLYWFSTFKFCLFDTRLFDTQLFDSRLFDTRLFDTHLFNTRLWVFLS